MTKELAFAINVIASMYFMGGLLTQHQKARELVVFLDSGFLAFLKMTKSQQPLLIIKFILKLFGVLAVVGFFGILVSLFFKIQSNVLIITLSIVTLISGLISGSLLWVLHHKKVFKQFFEMLLLFGAGALLLPFMDYFSGSNLTHLFSVMLSEGMSPIISYSPDDGILSETIYVWGVYSGIVLFMYITSWLYAAPIAILSCFIIAMPIWVARAIDKMFPKQPVVIVFLAMWLYSLTYLTFN